MCRKNVVAKVRRFCQCRNRTQWAFRIPMIWYAIYPLCGIAALAETAYLCTIIIYTERLWQEFM